MVLANKKDIQSAATAAEVSDLLSLSAIKDRPWSIRPTSALTGEGLIDGFTWYYLLTRHHLMTGPPVGL